MTIHLAVVCNLAACLNLSQLMYDCISKIFATTTYSLGSSNLLAILPPVSVLSINTELTTSAVDQNSVFDLP